MVLGCIALALLFVSRRASRSGHQDPGRPLVGLALIVAVGLALPPGPAALLHGPLGPQLGVGIPGDAIAHRSRVRATSTVKDSAAGRRSGASCPTRTPTSSSRSSARSSASSAPPWCSCSSGPSCWLGIRAATQAPDRFGALLAVGLVAVAGCRDADQRRRRGRGAAGHRHPPAVHLLRRLVARDHHGGGGRADQRGPSGRGRGRAPDRRAGWRPGEEPRQRRAQDARRPRGSRRASRRRGGVDPPAGRRPRSVSARRGTVIAGGGRAVASSPHCRSPARSCGGAGTRPTPSSSTGRGGGRRPPRGLRSNSPTRCCPDAGCGGACALRPGGPTPAPWWGLGVGLRPHLGSLSPGGRGGRHRGGLRGFPAGLAAGRHPGPARLREHRRRARGGQRAARALRRGQRRGVRRDGFQRTHVTGTPVRPDLASLDGTPEGRARSRKALDLPDDRQTVAAMGGSLGAACGSTAPCRELASAWPASGGRSVYQVTGRLGLQASRVPAEGAGAETATGCATASCPSRNARPICTRRQTCVGLAPAP